MMNGKRNSGLWLAVATATLLAGTVGLSQGGHNDHDDNGDPDDQDLGAPGVYRVIDGNVDEGTFQGYETYSRSCMACHGADGLGSSFAPSLLRAAERRTWEEFSRTVAEGQEIQPGQVMPSFADDPYVMQNLADVYSYLKARADGELGRGRPGIIEDDQE